MKITSSSGIYIKMVVMYCYLEREYYKDFKFHVNNSSLK